MLSSSIGCRLASVSFVVIALGGCQRSEVNPPYLGYAEGEYVHVAAPVSGRLVRLAVQRGDQVSAGQALFTLEQESERAAKDEAEARLKAAKAQLDNASKGRRPDEIRVAAEQLSQARAAMRLSSSQLERQRALVAQGFVSSSSLDTANTAYLRDAAHVKELEAQLATTRLPARTDEIAAARAEVEAAGQVVVQSAWRLEQKTQTAPVTGRVDNTFYRPGEYVAAAAPVVSVLPPDAIKLRFYVPETTVGTLVQGRQVSVRCDGCGEIIHARISFIAAEAEYSPPVIYSKENRAKLVFLIEARPLREDAPRLRPGLPVEVAVDAPGRDN